MSSLFSSELLDLHGLLLLVGRLALNLLFAVAVIRGVYHRVHENREYVFTYYVFNLITFCLTVVLRSVPLELGFALGLFAVFGILRYRTEEIRIRDLTYLFIVIGLGIVNAIGMTAVSVAELVVVNVAIVGLTAVIELFPASKGRRSVPVLYDNISKLEPGQEKALLDDLRERTGLAVEHVEVRSIDMMRDSASLVVYYGE